MFSTVIVYVINVPSFTTVPSVIELVFVALKLGFVVIAFVSTVFDDFSSELTYIVCPRLNFLT